MLTISGRAAIGPHLIGHYLFYNLFDSSNMFSPKFVYVVAGIFTIYFFFATMQEKLLKGVYGDGDKFVFVMSLLFINAMVCYPYTLFIRAIDPYTVEKPISTLAFCALALLQILAMSSSFMALQWVSYPAQVLAKSSKPIPVMLTAVISGQKTYPLRKYIIVFLIVFGVGTFFYNSEKAAASHSSLGIGELLLALSLLMDGILNSLQEKLMFKHKPNSNYLMMETNKWVVLMTFAIIVLSGEGIECIKFVQKYPSSLTLIFGMSICAALGQYFIYKGIIEFGTLSVSVITTVRKFFTVLSSVILFGHSLHLRQWIAVICVFSGLLLDTYFGKGTKKSVK